VSLRSCALCIVDSKGTVLFERELPCEVSDIAECLAGFPHPIERVGFEAGAMSQHLFFGLTAEGFDVVCMEARQVSAALSAMRNKTDKTDARGIAQILLTGWFSPVHMKSRKSHGLRALLSTRKALLKKTMDLANEVRGLLKIFGVRLAPVSKQGRQLCGGGKALQVLCAARRIRRLFCVVCSYPQNRDHRVFGHAAK
jgi:transposase